MTNMVIATYELTASSRTENKPPILLAGALRPPRCGLSQSLEDPRSHNSGSPTLGQSPADVRLNRKEHSRRFQSRRCTSSFLWTWLRPTIPSLIFQSSLHHLGRHSQYMPKLAICQCTDSMNFGEDTYDRAAILRWKQRLVWIALSRKYEVGHTQQHQSLHKRGCGRRISWWIPRR